MRLFGAGARIAAAALLVAWCVTSWVLSSQHDPEAFVGVHVPLNDKIEHGIEYATGGFLAACAMSNLKRLPMLAAGVAFCGIWGTTDEIHQSYVPGRDSSALDLVADVTGGTIGAAVFAGLAERRRRSAPESIIPLN